MCEGVILLKDPGDRGIRKGDACATCGYVVEWADRIDDDEGPIDVWVCNNCGRLFYDSTNIMLVKFPQSGGR